MTSIYATPENMNHRRLYACDQVKVCRWLRRLLLSIARLPPTMQLTWHFTSRNIRGTFSSVAHTSSRHATTATSTSKLSLYALVSINNEVTLLQIGVSHMWDFFLFNFCYYKIEFQVRVERGTRITWHNFCTTAKQVAMVWACAAKRRQWLGEVESASPKR